MIKKQPIIGIIPTFTCHESDPYQDRVQFVTMYSEKIIRSGGIPLVSLEMPVSILLFVMDTYGVEAIKSYTNIFL